MGHIDNAHKFLEYIKTPLTPEMITSLYTSCNIVHERCFLYRDMIYSLVKVVFTTYLGDDLTNDENRVKHFEWCWKKNIRNFAEENIFINTTDELYEYFLNFFIETFYSVQNKQDDGKMCANMLKLWAHIFDSNRVKTRSDLDMLVEIYGLFDVSLQKK